MSILNDISSLLQQGRAPKVKAAVQQALDEGIPASEILENGLLAGMNVIGQRFKNGEVFVNGDSAEIINRINGDYRIYGTDTSRQLVGKLLSVINILSNHPKIKHFLSF